MLRFMSTLGLRTQHKGDTDKALAAFDHAIKLDAKLSVAYRNRGGLYANKGDYDKAIADLTEASHLDPMDALAGQFLLIVTERKKQTELAARAK